MSRDEQAIELIKEDLFYLQATVGEWTTEQIEMRSKAFAEEMWKNLKALEEMNE